uniref:Immunoglobulin V-set domain-containing protein n=1 Tax=Equus asinus asinus TaxID=83772 RepID=A0A8C4LBU2_EQUAS
MEPLSAPVWRGYIPWWGLLLAITLLNFWKPPTAAQHTIESVPPNAVVGKDAILFVTNLPENLLGYVWYTGDRVEPKLQILSYVIDSSEITPWPRYNGQEKIYPDGSLLFQNATQEDTGYYILQVLKRTLTLLYEVGTRQLHIHRESFLSDRWVSVGVNSTSHKQD